MPTYSTALAKLAALNVAGVLHNYAIGDVPAQLQRAQLPALLVLPLDTQDDGAFRHERGAGFVATAFAGGARTVTYSVTHLLLIAPTTHGRGLRAHLPLLTDVIHAYFVALGADVTLGGDLLEPPHVRVGPGEFAYGGVTYHGCAFRHTWLMQV